MPLYEFECEGCKREFEELVPYGTERVPCPQCGSGEVHRKVSACAFSVGGRMTTSGSGCAGCSSTSCTSCSSARGHH